MILVSRPKRSRAPKPAGFNFYMGGFAGTILSVLGVGTSGVFLLPPALEKAAKSAAAEVVASTKEDIINLKAQMSETNRTLAKIEVGVQAALDFMAEQERIKQVIWTLVKQDSLKK